MSDTKKTNAPAKGAVKSSISRGRGFCALAVIAFVIAGLLFHIGSGTLSAFGIGSVAAICPLGALEVMLGAKEVMLHPLILFVLIVIVVVLTGRAFCSWVCPTPWIQRFFHPEKSKAKVAKAAKADAAAESADATEPAAESADTLFSQEEAAEITAQAKDLAGSCELEPVGGARDGIQLDSRHGVLLGTLLSAAIFGFPVFCLVCPVGLTFALIVALWNTFTANDPSLALVIAPALLIIELAFFRKWCGKLCPMGALISLISAGNRTFKPKVDTQKCLRSQGTDCRVCVNVCPEQVDPHSSMIPECTKCGKCVDACPAGAIKLKLL